MLSQTATILMMSSIVALTVTVGCGRCPYGDLPKDPVMAELKLLRESDPSQALAAALERGDKRFLGVAGFSLEVPGAEEVYDTLVQRHGIRTIEGTGDTGVDDDRAELIASAKDWAEKYNRMLIEKLKND